MMSFLKVQYHIGSVAMFISARSCKRGPEPPKDQSNFSGEERFLRSSHLATETLGGAKV